MLLSVIDCMRIAHAQDLGCWHTFLGLNATEPAAQGEKGPSLDGSDLSTQWLLSGKAVSPPSITSAAAQEQHVGPAQ